MSWQEVNFDGLIGPTHHYGGLAAGNLASQSHRHQIAHPRQAALQGLEKMKLLADLGVAQAVLPPHPRPWLPFLHAQGFTGEPREMIQEAAKRRPEALSLAYSSSAMWTANAATVSPASDASDGRLHLTPANLISSAHRELETAFTTLVLRAVFQSPELFCVHDPLPSLPDFADEGAANHMRLTPRHGTPGVEVFVFGRDAQAGSGDPSPRSFPARQTLQASERVAKSHGLPETTAMFCQQSPEAIDAGVFHNDVIAVSNENVLLCHEKAFVDQPAALQQIRDGYDSLNRNHDTAELAIIEISERILPLPTAVRTYLFNSQLVTLPTGGMLLLCPSECETDAAAQRAIELIRERTPLVNEVRFVDVRQSMRNGGGPACLRLRIVLNAQQRQQLSGQVMFTDALYEALRECVQKCYRDELSIADLADPGLVDESFETQAEIMRILGLQIEL